MRLAFGCAGMENELTSALENKNLIFAGSAGTKPSGKHAHIHTPTCTRACVKADIKACEVRVDCWHVRSTQAKPLASLNNATASAWHAAKEEKKNAILANLPCLPTIFVRA